MYFEIFCNNYCSKTIDNRIMKKVPKESKLIYAIKNFTVDSWCRLFLYSRHFKNKDKLKCHFSMTLASASMGIALFKICVDFKRILLENQKCNYINILLYIAFFFLFSSL